jgi:chromatin segregation and condensation protein Rec8/ScpA/Scc1 (kleisin family)
MKRDDLAPDELRKIIRRGLKEATPDQLSKIAHELEKRGLVVLPRKKREKEGRPPILKETKADIDRLMHIWIAIAITRTQTKSIDAALDRLFTTTVRSEFGNVSKRWLAFVGDKDEYEGLIRKDIARRRYYDAQKLLKSDPELRKRWMSNLKLAKRMINVKVLIKQ